MELKVSLPGMWTPTIRGINDCVLMDEAYKHAPSLHPMEYLKSINRARIYLKALTLSDLCHYDGNTINRNMVLGDTPAARVKTTLIFPEFPRPNQQDWHIWKAFIFRNFLNGDLSLSRGRSFIQTFP